MEYQTEQISREILHRLGLPVKDQNRYTIKCPEHSDRNPSCSITLNYNGRGFIKCWSCGFSSSLPSYYFQKIGRSIYRDLDISFSGPKKDWSPPVINYNKIPSTDFKIIGDLISIDKHPLGIKWLESRGLPLKTGNRFSLKYCKYGIAKRNSNPEDKDQWIYIIDRVIIPVYEQNQLISVEARDTKGEDEYRRILAEKKMKIEDHPYKKVLYPKNSSVNTLYRYDQVKSTEVLYLTEGIIDVMSLSTNPLFQNSSSLFHAIPTERQLFLLEPFSNIVFIPNNDEASMKGFSKLKEQFKSRIRCLKPPKEVNDINDILQGKHPRIKSIDQLVDSGWLKKITC